jgi:hypothetical protein
MRKMRHATGAADPVSRARTTGRGFDTSGLLTRGLLPFVIIAGLSVGLLWFTAIYEGSLRDPRYLDGWLLAGGMGLQLFFHIGIKSGFSPRSVLRWRTFHILLGYLLIAVFVSHCDFSWPDTALEWMLWIGFVFVTMSGAANAFFVWSMRSKLLADSSLSFERIPIRRAELERDVQAAIMAEDPAHTALGLPPPPYDAWIADLYANQLREFLQGPRHAVAHLIGSQRPLRFLIDEIDEVSRYVDARNRDKLGVIRDVVVEKDGLDFAHVHLGLSRGLMLLHVPITYALIVLTVAHVMIVYAFASGGW